MKSLEEVSRIVGLSRRTIQEYEKAGVISKPTHRTKRGYLRYDDRDIARLFQVRFYRELGYDTRDILEILSEPNLDRHQAITSQISEMRKKKERLEDLITVTEAIQAHDIPPEALGRTLPEIQGIPFDVILSAFSGGLRTVQASEDAAQELEDGEIEGWFTVIETALDLMSSGSGPGSQAVQEKIDLLYSRISHSISPSVYGFWGLWQLFAPGAELGNILDDLYGADSAKLLYEAVGLNVRHSMKAMVSPRLQKLIRTLQSLQRSRIPPDSREVQTQVTALLHTLYEETGVEVRQWQTLSGLWNREAFQSWELPENERAFMTFLVQAMNDDIKEKENLK